MPAATARSGTPLPIDMVQRRRDLPAAAARTIARLFAAPGTCFDTPYDREGRGSTLACLALARIVPWCVAMAVYSGTRIASDPQPLPMLPIHDFVGPTLARVLADWLAWMVPAGLPLLYGAAGLTTHLSLVLTGATWRPLAATLRAVGLALVPAALVVGVAELALRLGGVSATVYLAIVALAALVYLGFATFGVARTQACGAGRAALAALLPMTLAVAAPVLRGLLELPGVPFLPPPTTSPYYIP